MIFLLTVLEKKDQIVIFRLNEMPITNLLLGNAAYSRAMNVELFLILTTNHKKKQDVTTMPMLAKLMFGALT